MTSDEEQYGPCQMCGGNGWTVEPQFCNDGNEVEPMQAQCSYCAGTGMQGGY